MMLSASVIREWMCMEHWWGRIEFLGGKPRPSYRVGIRSRHSIKQCLRSNVLSNQFKHEVYLHVTYVMLCKNMCSSLCMYHDAWAVDTCLLTRSAITYWLNTIMLWGKYFLLKTLIILYVSLINISPFETKCALTSHITRSELKYILHKQMLSEISSFVPFNLFRQ